MMALLCCPQRLCLMQRRVPICLTRYASRMVKEVMALPTTGQNQPPPRPRTAVRCANIMNQKMLALLHAAAGMEMHVQTHHAAVTPRKMIVVGIVNGKLVSASLHCSRHARRRANQEPMCALKVAHLWTIVSNVSLQPVCGKRISAKNHGNLKQERGLKVASGTGSSTSSATNFNQVPHIQVGATKWERREESGQSARS